jgi:hypothetical protein
MSDHQPNVECGWNPADATPECDWDRHCPTHGQAATSPVATVENFGHVPVANDIESFGNTPNDKPVCARCCRRVRKWSSYTVGYDDRAGVLWENGWLNYWTRVPWPCTSAVILGIAPRPTVEATR